MAESEITVQYLPNCTFTIFTNCTFTLQSGHLLVRKFLKGPFEGIVLIIQGISACDLGVHYIVNSSREESFLRE
jgi:hypothetical protein